MLKLTWVQKVVLSQLTNLDIDGATDIGAAIVDADLFIIDDGAGGTNRKTAASRLKTYIGGDAGGFPLTALDIDGGTDIGAALVDADLFIIDDGAGGTNRKVATASRVKTYIGSSTAADDLTIGDAAFTLQLHQEILQLTLRQMIQILYLKVLMLLLI